MGSAVTEIGEAVRRFLDAPRFAAVATLNHDGSPHVTVVWYELRGSEILINTTATRVKARNLSRDPRVAILCGDSERYVRIEGRARLAARGRDALEDIRRLGIRYEGVDAAERQVRAVWSKQERVSYALTAERVYAYGIT
jgi:PPOX class probable F420-dependent enzyme